MVEPNEFASEIVKLDNRPSTVSGNKHLYVANERVAAYNTFAIQHGLPTRVDFIGSSEADAALLELRDAVAAAANSDLLYMYAATRLNSSIQVQAAPAGKEFQCHQFIFGTPNYDIQNPRFFIQSFYTVNTGAEPSEFAFPNTIDYQGLSINIGGVPSGNGAITGGTWYRATASGSQTWSINPATNDVGILLDPIPVTIPANSLVTGRVAMGVQVGQSFCTCTQSRLSKGEGTKGAATSLEADLTSFATLGTTGSIIVFTPMFMVAQSVGRNNRPVFQLFGDSIMFGRNEVEQASGPRGEFGWCPRGLDDNTNGRRYAYGQHAVAGLKPSGWSSSSALTRRLAAIDACPNVPFTHNFSAMGTNGVALVDYRGVAGLRTYMSGMFGWIKAKWPNIPLIQAELLPKSSSSDLYTTLVNQTFPDDSKKWFAGSADAVYAAHPMADLWLFNKEVGGEEGLGDPTAYFRAQNLIDDSFAPWLYVGYDISTNRDKWRLSSWTATLTADHLTGSTFVMDIAPLVGDTIAFGPTPADLTTVVIVTGTGPYTVTVLSAIENDYLTGTAVKSMIPGDTTGVHPNTVGHKLIAAGLETWKVGRF
ncbi:MAG: hypothetical protein MN733_05150 [Nitrososphaera sp.]|nr:hypothetical protein [Nitrososphaera sp.]